MNNILEQIAKVNSVVNDYVWGIPMLCLILGTGVFYTIISKFYQVTHFKEVLSNTVNSIFKKSKNKTEQHKNALTQFQALTTALAATIGTGNIAGVATAIVVGGPGSIFWMWICAIFGMATHFAEIVLGIYYRKKDTDGSYKGGPMYYLENGFKKEYNLATLGKILAVLFALFTFVASFGIGNMSQVNSISDALYSNFGISVLYVGIIIAVISALVIFGGVKRIGQVAERIVPFMSCFYIIVGLIIVCLNYQNVPLVFKSIITSAWDTKAIAGGALGTVIIRAMTYGFKRGAFSNEAGLGSSVVAHSSSTETEPVKQGMWGIFEVFFDTIVVCTFTALIVLSSNLNAPSIYEALNNITTNDTIVCIDDSLRDADGNVMLVDNNMYHMPIKLDSNNNAHFVESIFDFSANTNIPNIYPVHNSPNGKQYLPAIAYGKSYMIEMLPEEDDKNDNDYFFGNVLKIRGITNGEIDANGNPVITGIHVDKLNGVSLVTMAVSNKLSHIAGKILAIAVTLFAFTTVLGWSYYGSNSANYLFGKFGSFIYKVAFIFFIILGATMKLDLVWDISDTLNGMMAVPNLLGVLLLSPIVMKIVKNYYDRKNNKSTKAMITAYVGNEIYDADKSAISKSTVIKKVTNKKTVKTSVTKKTSSKKSKKRK